MKPFPGILAILTLVFGITSASAADLSIALHSTKDSFENVKENIEQAIQGKGLVINTVSRIGEMLERTGKDLGASKQIYRHAELLEFCSATVSRSMMEADPRNIVLCPFTIAIYVLPAEPAKVYVAYRKSGFKNAASDKLLSDIIKEAIPQKP